MQTLNQDLKEQSYKQIYLLYGEEDFLKKSYKNRLKEAIVGDDTMNFSQFAGKEADFVKFRDIAETLPFFAERRCILLEDTGLFKNASEEWAEYLKELPETTFVIFVESQVDKRNKLYKTVTQKGYAAVLDRQGEKELSRWILGMLKKEGKQITGNAMELFLMKAGDDMEHIRTELEKLICYVGERDGILPEDVEAVCIEQTENRIFEMISAISAGHLQKAMDLYYDLLALKEPSMRILFLVAKQFNQLMQIKEMMMARAGQNEIAQATKLKPFVVSRLMGQARGFSSQQLKNYVELCVATEEAVKTGRLAEKVAVEMVIVKLTKKIQ